MAEIAHQNLVDDIYLLTKCIQQTWIVSVFAVGVLADSDFCCNSVDHQMLLYVCCPVLC